MLLWELDCDFRCSLVARESLIKGSDFSCSYRQKNYCSIIVCCTKTEVNSTLEVSELLPFAFMFWCQIKGCSIKKQELSLSRQLIWNNRVEQEQQTPNLPKNVENKPHYVLTSLPCPLLSFSQPCKSTAPWSRTSHSTKTEATLAKSIVSRPVDPIELLSLHLARSGLHQ